jgi:hypothetical protein
MFSGIRRHRRITLLCAVVALMLGGCDPRSDDHKVDAGSRTSRLSERQLEGILDLAHRVCGLEGFSSCVGASPSPSNCEPRFAHAAEECFPELPEAARDSLPGDDVIHSLATKWRGCLETKMRQMGGASQLSAAECETASWAPSLSL